MPGCLNQYFGFGYVSFTTQLSRAIHWGEVLHPWQVRSGWPWHRVDLWGGGRRSPKNVETTEQMWWRECIELLHTGDLFLYTGAAHQLSRRKTKQRAKQDPHWAYWSSNSYCRMAQRTMKQQHQCMSKCYTRLYLKRKVQIPHRRRTTYITQTFMCSARRSHPLGRRWNTCTQKPLPSTPPFASPRSHLVMTATVEPWCEPLGEAPVSITLLSCGNSLLCLRTGMVTTF